MNAAYVDTLSGNEDAVLSRVRRQITERGMPEISVQPLVARILSLLVAIQRPTRVLEIGALGGLSAIVMGRRLPASGQIVSLELAAHHIAVARRHLAEAGLIDRVRHVEGPAVEQLPRLQSEGLRFDFFLIDADKANYPAYLEWCITLANPGAVIAADNTLFHGRVADSSRRAGNAEAEALHRFNLTLSNDPRLEGVLLPVADGFSVARVLE